MSNRFEGKNIVVTGGASGIGAATVRRFLKEGGAVAAVDLEEGAVNEFVKRESPSGDYGSLRGYACDVSDSESVNSTVEQIASDLGGIDIVINNAGVGGVGKAADVTNDGWRKVMAVDLDGVFYVSRATLPHLIRSKGNMVNTASISGLYGDTALVAYDTAKGGVVNFTRATAVDYGHDGVRVNAVCPGPVQTPMLMEALKHDEISQQYVDRVPIGRTIKPEEIANAISFLASDDAAAISGVNLPVDGGLTAWTGQPDISSHLTT